MFCIEVDDCVLFACSLIFAEALIADSVSSSFSCFSSVLLDEAFPFLILCKFLSGESYLFGIVLFCYVLLLTIFPDNYSFDAGSILGA